MNGERVEQVAMAVPLAFELLSPRPPSLAVTSTTKGGKEGGVMEAIAAPRGLGERGNQSSRKH